MGLKCAPSVRLSKVLNFPFSMRKVSSASKLLAATRVHLGHVRRRALLTDSRGGNGPLVQYYGCSSFGPLRLDRALRRGTCTDQSCPFHEHDEYKRLHIKVNYHPEYPILEINNRFQRS